MRSRDFDANSTVDCTWTLPPQHGINIVANIRILDFATDTGHSMITKYILGVSCLRKNFIIKTRFFGVSTFYESVNWSINHTDF